MALFALDQYVIVLLSRLVVILLDHAELGLAPGARGVTKCKVLLQDHILAILIWHVHELILLILNGEVRHVLVLHWGIGCR